MPSPLGVWIISSYRSKSAADDNDFRINRFQLVVCLSQQVKVRANRRVLAVWAKLGLPEEAPIRLVTDLEMFDLRELLSYISHEVSKYSLLGSGRRRLRV